MAITFIYPIKATGEKSLKYDLEDKETVIVKRDGGQDSLSYDMRDKRGNVYKLSSEYLDKMKNYIRKEPDGKIVFETLSTALNCSGNYEEWRIVRNQMNPSKGSTGNLQYCIVQNFGVDLDPAEANEIGVEFAREYLADYQCVVSTHINTGYVHNHIEFNATSFVTGRKFNDELNTISEIRRLSDRLCQEHELEVLENTKKFRYILYKDSNGKIRVYEPTERKNRKKEGEFYNKNDYRNTLQYSESNKYRKVHIKTLQHDIDMFLPYVSSYEELLGQLRSIGYEIKEKTKTGAWRKHISFKYPGWGAYTRDIALGRNYEREDIERKIAGNTIVDNELKAYILNDIKRTTKELNVPLETIIRNGREQFAFRKRIDGKEYLLDCINRNLQSVKFLDQKNIKNFSQLEEGAKNLFLKRSECCEQLLAIKRYLVYVHSVLGLAYEFCGNEEASRDNIAENMLHKLNLQDKEKQEQLRAKYKEYNRRYEKLVAAVELIDQGISEYDNCVSCIKNIDRYVGRYKSSIESYNQSRLAMGKTENRELQ